MLLCKVLVVSMTIVKKVHDTSKMWSTLAPMHIQYDELRAKNDENENLYHKHKTMAKELQMMMMMVEEMMVMEGLG